jgi:PmbA protein
MGAMVQKTQGTDMVFCWYGRSWRELNSYFDSGLISSKIIKDLKNCSQIVEAPTGNVPIFVSPDMLLTLLHAVTLGVNGKNVVKGNSPLKGKLGEQLFDPQFTLIDDPHLDYGMVPAEIDEDGVSTRRIEIIKDGVLKEFLYDLDTAGMAGVEPTGNTGCNPYSLTIPGGTFSKDDLLGQIEDGIYIKSLMGFGQGNLINGDFSSNISLGFRVKNGKIVGRVKDTMAAGNIYSMLKSGIQLSKEVDPVTRMPYALIQGAHIS